MDRLILVISMLYVALGLGESAYGQGTIVFNNLDRTDGQVFVFTDFWSGIGVPLNQDLNFELKTAQPGGIFTIQRTWLLSDGTAKGINVAPGRFADPSHSVIVLSGIPPGGGVNVEVNAWAGNYNRLADAMNAGAGFGFGRGFTMNAGSAATPPTSLMGMPALEVRGVPEPQPFHLAMIGGIVLVYIFCCGVAKTLRYSHVVGCPHRSGGVIPPR